MTTSAGDLSIPMPRCAGCDREVDQAAAHWWPLQRHCLVWFPVCDACERDLADGEPKAFRARYQRAKRTADAWLSMNRALAVARRRTE